MTTRRWTWRRIAALAVVAAACGSRDRPKPVAAPAFANPAQWRERAPDTFRARFETTAGSFVIEVHRAWAPLGADRFYNLVKSGYFDGTRFFRVISGFMVQFGIHGDPLASAAWHDQRIADDPVLQSNRPGMASFATAGPGTRTTQVFINYGDNSRLDAMGFAPFGQVVEGMDVVNRLYAGYGEGAPGGLGPVQGRIQAEGNAYLDREFPKLDQVRRATLVAPAGPGALP
ncbi:MAG TPA: peptidylprolyl isomerase [Gemmatimonadales bacterium]|jgi:peptidyl-prolyl cis-trans isomerase A (cyclophilin A)|nr:peptidylprolyl isomerase [Gemmatimonadales bacterium]